MEQVSGKNQDIDPLDIEDPNQKKLYLKSCYLYFDDMEKKAAKQKKAALMALRELGINWEDTSLEPDKPFFDTILTKDQLYEIGTNIG